MKIKCDTAGINIIKPDDRLIWDDSILSNMKQFILG